MRKSILLVGIIAIMFLGIGTAAAREADSIHAFPDADTVVNQLAEQLAQEDPQTLDFQRKLANWYNLNLTSWRKEAGYADSYRSILDYSDHALGYLSIPSIGLCLPIYHGDGRDVLQKGIGHAGNSAFPTGGEGNHSVLIGEIDVAGLAEGDYFFVHILQDVRAYRIVDMESAVQPADNFEPVEGEELCTLVAGADGGVKRIVRGSYAESAPQEQSIMVTEVNASGDSWWIAACAGMAVGILIMPFLFRRRRGKREKRRG